MGYGEACLFANFASNARFSFFLNIKKTAGEIKGPLSRFFGTTTYKQLVPAIYDKGNRGCTGIEIVGKSALDTAFGFLVVLLEVV